MKKPIISKLNNRLIFAVSVFLLTASQSNLVLAADDPYANQAAPYGYNPGYQNYPPQGAQGYGPNTDLTPGYRPPNYRNRNYGGGPSFSGPWNNSRGNSMPWSSNRGGSTPWSNNRGSSMPWSSNRGSSNRGSSMPWDNRRGGRNMPWDSGRGGWMDKDRFANRWDDMLNAPSDMGELPGGYTAPSISAPNPVDVGDEFQDAARDAPDQMRNVYDDNRQSR
jgi:hypothetical protein